MGIYPDLYDQLLHKNFLMGPMFEATLSELWKLFLFSLLAKQQSILKMKIFIFLLQSMHVDKLIDHSKLPLVQSLR